MKNVIIETPVQAISEITRILTFTNELFSAIIDKSDEEIGQWKFKASYRFVYDFEQLMDYAVVHVLRHRKKIANF